MKKTEQRILIFFFILGLLFSPGKGYGQPVVYREFSAGSIRVEAVIADLSSREVTLNLYVASRSRHLTNRSFPHEPFGWMIGETHPTAAINGTYYDTRTYTPVGTLAASGQMLQRGTHGIAVCFDAENHVYFYKIRDLRNFPWQQFKIVLSTGPTLVLDGHMHIYPWAEKFHDPSLFRPARRSALGLTSDNKLLLVAVAKPIQLRDMAWIMKKLGAVHAVSLDGGSSTALYYRGRTIIHPSRLLTNIFLVYERKEATVSGTSPEVSPR